MNGKLEKEKKSEDRIFDFYLFVNYANKGKIEKVRNTLKEYKKTAKDISKFLWNVFFKSGKLPNKKKINIKHIKHIPRFLSERYKYVCLWQVHDVLSSYIANIQRQFADIVFNSTLNKEDKLILLALNNDNRKDTQEFECKACGNKTNAQINGTLTKKQVLRMLAERCLERLKGRKSPTPS